MRLLHGLITLVSAIVIIAFGGSWLFEKFGIGHGLGILDAAKSGYELNAFDYPYKKVPVKAPEKLSVQVEELLGGSGWLFNRRPRVPLPAILGRPQLWGGLSYNGSSQIGNTSLYRGGDCKTPTVNLVEHDTEFGPGKPLFDHRVFLPSYAYHEEENERQVYALVIDQDSDKDGFYTCWDKARLEFLSLEDMSKTVFERVFVPANISDIYYDLREKQLVFVERKEIGEKIQQNTLKISFAGEIISEENAPDLLSEAKAAFERTESE